MAAIKAEVDGMTFDGDESAQSRMARAITAAETAGLESSVWVLADNTVATVTKAQRMLKKSLLANIKAFKVSIGSQTYCTVSSNKAFASPWRVYA